MNIKLYYNSSEENKLSKELTNELSLQGTLRVRSDLLNPDILMDGIDFTIYNYAYIPLFERYYFIRGYDIYRNDLYVVHMEVDVLQTYKDEIKYLPSILMETESYGADEYLSSDRIWVAKEKDKTDIYNFSNGLLDNGEYILITAGG